MKIGKNIKLFMILILFFVIIFMLLGHFNVFKEGHSTTAPTCSNSEITEEGSEDYYLSTELIPPICPTCPYYEPSNLTGHDEYHKYHDFSDDVSGGNGYVSDKAKASYLDKIFGSSGQNSNNSDSNNNNKNSNNTSVDNKNSNNTSVDNKNSNNTSVGSNNTQNQNVTQQSQTNKINTDNSTNTATNTNTDNSTDTSVTTE